MIRGENVVCGTTSTGTGTLTLAACPSSVGAVDPVVAFGTSGAYPISYTLVEYADSTFAKPVQYETGVATMTLAATITSATLARAPITTSVIATPTYSGGSSTPSAITIGTAANVLVFMGPNAHNILESLHFVVGSMTGTDSLGVSPVVTAFITNLPLSGATSATTGTVYYQKVWLASSGLIKSASFYVTAALTGATTSTCAQALYDIASTGLPGKKLIDFGSPAAGVLNSTGLKTSSASSAMFIPAGFYIHAILPIGKTGAAGTLNVQGLLSIGPSPFGTLLSAIGAVPIATISAQTVLNDPATTTSITGVATAYEVALAYRAT